MLWSDQTLRICEQTNHRIEQPNNLNNRSLKFMRKRERDNPCGLCEHYHNFEEGEVCGVCGHHPDKSALSSVQVSVFPSEILPEFLYLGSYANASRVELLKTQGIYCILNTVPGCQNLYKNTFTYYCLQDDQKLSFDDAIQFLEQCKRDKARVLVHCMSGKNRSPAIVMAYLMKSKGWKLEQSYQWVKDRRPSVELNQVVSQQLQEYEQKIFGSIENSSLPPFSFGFSRPNDPPVPAFNNPGGASILSRAPSDIPPQNFTFGAGEAKQRPMDDSTFNTNTNTNTTMSDVNDVSMGGS